MPRCTSCGRNYDDLSAIELVRNNDNRWIAVCRSCMDMGVDINTLQPTLLAVDDKSADDTLAIEIPASGNPLEDAKKLLESLRNLRRSKERVGKPRSFERRAIELTVHFSLSRDDTRHEGLVKDFSQGGLRVITTYPLTKGQIVRFDWNTPLPPALSRMLQGTGEVRRSIKGEGNTYDVGFKFLTRPSDKGANRRRFRRYRCDLLVFYRRQKSEVISRGRVVDISQGGCQLNLNEKLESNEVFWVRIVGGGGTKGDLTGMMRTCRIIAHLPKYETGCSFEKMNVEAPVVSGAK